MAIGSKFAKRYRLSVGSQIKMIDPKVQKSLAGGLVRQKSVTVSAIIDTGDFRFDNSGFLVTHSLLSGFDNNFADKYYNLALKISEPSRSSYWQSVLSARLYDDGILVKDWSEDYWPFVKGMEMQKMALFVLLLFMISLVACNLFGNTTIIVQNKHADIAILRAFGIDSSSIWHIFTALGLFISVLGIILGLAGGIVVSWYLPDIVAFIENYWGIVLYDSNLYYATPRFPSLLKIYDLFTVGLSSLLICFLAIFYPSYKASKLNISAILRKGG